MDTSNEYIKMCQQAMEIQEAHEMVDGDYYYDGELDYPDDKRVYFIFDGTKATAGTLNIEQWERPTDDAVWLPRQDQLQDMLMDDFKDYGHIVHSFVEYLCDTTDYHGGIRFADVDIYGDFTSFEQLWLAFLMDEKYSKYWNGKDWVLEGD